MNAKLLAGLTGGIISAVVTANVAGETLPCPNILSIVIGNMNDGSTLDLNHVGFLRSGFVVADQQATSSSSGIIP